jgi:NAD(P)-dependent dehydrogenase (short-subunit alcohol dehydrogenase family)
VGSEGALMAAGATDLAGEVAVVTGAAQGIGMAIARRFAEAGARVVVADIQTHRAEEVAATIRAAGGDARAIGVDIADPDSVRRLHAEVRSTHGPAGILVANAARITIRPFLEMSHAEWEGTIATNVTGTYACARAFCEDMIERGRGSIVILSSVNGERAQVGLSAYNVSKAALSMLARTLALELAPHGIRVNAIAPGDIATEAIERVADQAAAQAVIPLGRHGHAAEVAEMALFLASDRASYTTGSVLSVDGGLGAQLYPDPGLLPESGETEGRPA